MSIDIDNKEQKMHFNTIKVNHFFVLCFLLNIP